MNSELRKIYRDNFKIEENNKRMLLEEQTKKDEREKEDNKHIQIQYNTLLSSFTNSFRQNKTCFNVYLDYSSNKDNRESIYMLKALQRLKESDSLVIFKCEKDIDRYFDNKKCTVCFNKN